MSVPPIRGMIPALWAVPRLLSGRGIPRLGLRCASGGGAAPLFPRREGENHPAERRAPPPTHGDAVAAVGGSAGGLAAPRRKKLVKQQDPRAPRHPTAPDTLAYPPWISSREDVQNKVWQGRSEASPGWVRARFERLSRVKDLSWDKFFVDKREKTVSSVNYLMRLMTRAGRPKAAIAVFREMHRRGYSPDSFSYVAAIDACAEMGDADTSMIIFEQMKTAEVADEAGYGVAIKALIKAGRHEAAASLMEEGRERGVAPNKVTYTTLMSVAADRGDVKAVDMVKLDMMVAGEFPDRVTYNTMLYGCARAGDGPRALDVFDEMGAYNVRRDLGAYNSLLRALCRSGMEEDANKVFNEMLKSQAEGDGSLAPTLETYTVVLQFYADRGDVDNCLQMIHAVKSSPEGPRLDGKAWGAVLDASLTAAVGMGSLSERRALARRGDAFLRDALQDIRGGGGWEKEAAFLITKNVSVWAAGLAAREAEERLGEFEARGVRPTPLAFAALLNMWERLADGDGAAACLRKMKACGLDPSPSFALRVALSYARGGFIDDALAVVRGLVDEGKDISSIKERWSLDHCLGKVWAPPNTWGYAPGHERGDDEVERWRGELEAACGPYVKPESMGKRAQKERERRRLEELNARRYEVKPGGGWGPRKGARVVLLKDV